MINKIYFSLALIIIVIFLPLIAFAQNQYLNLKSGDNFVSLSIAYNSNIQQFMSQFSTIESIKSYSAIDKIFLSTDRGTLSTIVPGQGYIFRCTSASNPTISGSTISNIGDIELKTGYNLVGFSKMPETITFNQLMTKFSIIKRIQKWSPAGAGYFIVSRNNSGEIVGDSDPMIRSGESYFIYVYADTKLNYDGSNITFSPPNSSQVISKVASPTFTPIPGSYLIESLQSITISCATTDSTIYYTRDGTTPSVTNGTIYSMPISITPAAGGLIKAIAIKNGMSNSDIATAIYTY